MRNRRKAVSLLTGLLVTAQLFPTAALAADSSESALNKAPGYQDFPAYYSDSAHADDQVTHPDVVVLEEPWNGYRYWAVYTPNVMRISIYENPSIVASSDGVHWVEPEGLSNPIEPQPPSTRYHNCDADMVYNAEYDAMMAYWNWADDQGGGVGAEVRLRISYDGVHWGVPVTYDEMTRVWSKPTSDAERQVADGEDDFITAIASPDRYDMLSPTIVYDDFRDVFILWVNNTGDVGYQNGQANFVEMRYSDDGITWGEPVRVNGFLGLDENGQQLAPWHQDVQYVPDLKEFVCISQCFAGRNPDGSVLHLTTSKDGVNWEQVGTKPLLSPGPDGSWDDFQIYRSSFYYEPGSSAGDGTMRVWYSALQKDTNNKMVADSSGNLTIQAKSEDDRIWRIGYAENSFVEMMRVLLDDPGYTTPALVSGNSLMLSAETTSLPTGDVMKLETSFAPVDTSDQVVKYTSSDPDVATVDEFGTITGVSVGSARIMAETREGLSDDLEIAVVENPYTLIPQSNMTATATSVYGGTTEGPASNVLDGNVRTIWHTNYAPKDELPQSMLCLAMFRASSVNTVGLCHSHQACVPELLAELGMPWDGVSYKISGINHMAWLLEISRNGEDLYPIIRKRAQEGPIYAPTLALRELHPEYADRIPSVAEQFTPDNHHDMVRFEIMKQFGYFVTESSEHSSEYYPWFIKKDHPELIDRFHIPLDEYPRRCRDQIARWKQQAEHLVHNENLTHTRSSEYAAGIIEALETGRTFGFAGNVLNTGLIDNLPFDACVEVSCMVNEGHLSPCHMGPLPNQLAALNRRQIEVHQLTVDAALTRKKEYIYQAAMLDPHAGSELTIDEIRSLVDDLIQAHGDWLPEYH